MKLSEFQTEILSWMKQVERQTGRGVTEFQLIRQFDEGVVLGIGYTGVLNDVKRLVKRGLVVEQHGRFKAA